MKTWPVAALLIRLIGLAVVGAGTHEAAAQGHTRTGNEMLPACRAFLEGSKLFEHATAEQAVRAGFCAGYVTGILEESTDACVPAVSAREAVLTVVEDLVERALIATWPCPQRQSPDGTKCIAAAMDRELATEERFSAPLSIAVAL